MNKANFWRWDNLSEMNSEPQLLWPHSSSNPVFTLQLTKEKQKGKKFLFHIFHIICCQRNASWNETAPCIYQNGQNPEHWQHQMLARVWSNRNSLPPLVGTQDGTATLGSLMVSYKTKHTLTIWSSNHVSWYLPKGTENLGLKKNLYVDIYRCFILNCQNLEATKISFSRWMNK